MSMFIRQQWNDSRLMYNESLGITHLELDTKVMKNVWVPDLFINNEKKANIHHVTVPNMLMHIYPDGKVVYSMRYDMHMFCVIRKGAEKNSLFKFIHCNIRRYLTGLVM